MPRIEDRDSVFVGTIEASLPSNVVTEGVVKRLINARFVEGAITNGIGFDELPFTFEKEGESPFTSPVTHQQLLELGDVQLVAPLVNIAGKFLVSVISGIAYKYDLESLTVSDITPRDSFLPENSSIYPLSYTDNDGGTLGVGGYLVIFNYPNKCILVNHEQARLANSNPDAYEVIPSRMGTTSGIRLFAIQGDILLYVSDPLGDVGSLAPLTFEETLSPSGTYTGQVPNIGSALDIERVTALCRLPKYGSPSQDFLAQQLVVSTKHKKYLIASGSPRSSWDDIQFISYISSADGMSGTGACTLVGQTIVYVSTDGRFKTLSQDQELETALSETFLDDSLGQYLNRDEVNLYHRDWYRKLDHSRSLLKYSKDRLWGTSYPVVVPAIDKFGNSILAPTHRALAVGSLDSTTKLGPQASISWEGFYDWLQPIGLVTLDDDLYVVSKDEYGRIKYYVRNLEKLDNHTSIIYTRGYFGQEGGYSRSLLEVSLYFRRIYGNINIKIYYAVDNEWILGSNCFTSSKLCRFSMSTNKQKTDDTSIPLRIEIDHKGCRFELSSIRVKGEQHRQEK